MGMDVVGRNPKNETGEYFRANVWGWRPIHFYSFLGVIKHQERTGYDDLIPSKTLNGMSMNTGHGLRSDRKSMMLGLYIEEMIQDDFDRVWSEQYDDNSIKWGVNEENDFYVSFSSEDTMEGKLIKLMEEEGLTPMTPTPTESTPYCVDREYLQEWSDFLQNCGGFQVW